MTQEEADLHAYMTAYSRGMVDAIGSRVRCGGVPCRMCPMLNDRLKNSCGDVRLFTFDEEGEYKHKNLNIDLLREMYPEYFI